MSKQYQTVRLILGDQLNLNHSWFNEIEESTLYVMMEILPESEYVTHHIQKIVGIFGAMRHFCKFLKSKGHSVVYYKIGDDDNRHSFLENVSVLIEKYSIDKLEYQEPDEYRLDHQFKQSFKKLPVAVEMVTSEHFFTQRSDVKTLFSGKKQMVMEHFYRTMRSKTGILMDGDRPITGKWNYDHENRRKLPKKIDIPAPKLFEHDLTELHQEILAAGIRSIGTIQSNQFSWPLTREESLETLEYFCVHLLPFFGQYQDAMTDRSWSIFHSRLSFSMNLKIISPREVIDRVIEEWHGRNEEISIAQVEGFVRQILGWREFMRGIYWAHMPDYASLNFFNNNRSLPFWYWNGQTNMKCLQQAISQSLEYAYAHHIQRLMVTGNFALLAGVHPDEVDQWYLGIYIDAFDWVEITNTRGMSQFADGGIVGTKPYVSSGSYINRMSDHCGNCRYDHKKRTGENACPFNSLYWNFLDQHRNLLGSNPRMTMMYRVWDKMASEEQENIINQAQLYLKTLEEL